MDSATVFELRKVAKELNGDQKLEKLEQAFDIAKRLFHESSYDEWVKKAYAWVLIDLCKYHLSLNNLSVAANYFSRLADNKYADDIIENQVAFLKPKVNINYSVVKEAEEFSKANKHKEALNIFNSLIKENKLTEIHHEAYGWVIYRYIKSDDSGLNSIGVRTLLRDYMNLKNERPSLLHSMILNFALNYSKEHTDFNLYNFFKLWNPINLRNDDKSEQHYEGKNLPSLVSRIFRVFIESNYSIEIDFLLNKVQMQSWGGDSTSEQKVLDFLREPYFWKIFNANKEKRFSDQWELFKKYNTVFSKYTGSKWHSEVLNLADRYMIETEEWRFLDFFKQWNPKNLQGQDWQETQKEEHVYKPLAVKCLKKAFAGLKAQADGSNNVEWLLDVYNLAVSKYPQDEWLKRERALLLIRNEDLDSAIEVYKSLVLELGDKAYIWKEFSSCFHDKNDLKIGMLSKALQLERNEDFLGDIHLELAQALIESSLLENAMVELSTYKRHREEKGWKLSETYNKLIAKTSDSSTTLKNNKQLYEKFVPKAEEFAYQDIEWSSFVLYDVWKNPENNKERCNFTNGNGIDFSISKRRFKQLRNARIGNVFELKLHKEEKEPVKKEEPVNWRNIYSAKQIEYKYIPLLLKNSLKEDWSTLEDEIAVIDYINTEKNVIHVITAKNEEIFFKDDIQKYKVNDFILSKRLETKRKDEVRIELKNIKAIEKETAMDKFDKVLAVVDNINQEKNLFHFVANKTIHGIVRFRETDLRPTEGDVFEVRIAKKTDRKRNKVIYKAIELEETSERPGNLVKSIQGTLELKYKIGGYTRDFSDLDEDEIREIKPDFGFVNDFYVPKYILKKFNISCDCNVTAKAVFSGEKWKIIELEKND